VSPHFWADREHGGRGGSLGHSPPCLLCSSDGASQRRARVVTWSCWAMERALWCSVPPSYYYEYYYYYYYVYYYYYLYYYYYYHCHCHYYYYYYKYLY
jgi:hypothetical protein